MIELGAVLGVVVAGAVLLSSLIPYWDGKGMGDARDWAGMGSVPWYFYKLGAKHGEAKRGKVERRVREWQARKR